MIFAHIFSVTKVVLASENRYKLSFAPFVRSPVVNEACPVVMVSALCVLQCFDTDGWVSGRTSDL